MATIDDLSAARVQFEDVLSAYREKKVDKAAVREIVNRVELLQKQYDIESGFAEAQLFSHDFFFKVPTTTGNIGNIDNNLLINILTNLQDVFNTVQPHFSASIEYKMVGVAPGSIAVMYDIVDRAVGTKAVNVDSAKAKDVLEKVFTNAPAFMDKGFTEQKLHTFQSNTGLGPQEAYEITKSLLKLMPDEYVDVDKVELGVNNNEVQTTVSAEVKDRLNLSKSKKNLYEMVKPEERLEIVGKLGIMEEWDVNHKISIIDADRDIYTVNYAPSKENIDRIKNNIGKEVKIRRSRDDSDKRKWLLVEWLA